MITPKNHKDKAEFQKLNVSSYMELALIAPARYEDFNLYKSPKPNELNVVEICIDRVEKNSKFLKLHAKAWDRSVEVIIFNPSNFHFVNFKAANKFFVQTRVEYAFGKLRLLQPKIVNEVGKILPIYKTAIAQKSMMGLIKEYLRARDLEEEGLPKIYAKTLYDLHNPSSANYDDALKNALKALKFGEIYIFLKRLNSKKQHFKASALLNGDERDFVKKLPFSLTDEQKKAIADIKSDLSKPLAARRVIMGDVGSGKTVVIFAAVMIALPKRSVLMVPTTILAKQIFDEARRLLPSHVKSVLITSGDKDVDLQNADFIIGTHVLLYTKLPKCDLVMIDEQHRFGTAQRDAIHKMVSESKEHPHFLQFSATPIPRTMSLIHSSLVSYSFIKQTPYKKDIDTYIIGKNDFGKMLGHIENEIKEGRQSIIIYPLVEESEAYNYQSIDEGRAFWEKRYKDVYVTHGKDKNKEAVLEEFNKSGSILLATTVVEVGISLPKLSTIIIVGAEHLGLATLHQLRGRVSRNGLKGYCYLYTNTLKNERLLEFANTKNGFDIAEIDLKYRQSGDLLSGILQHGAQFKWFSIKDDKAILLEVKKSLSGLAQ
ncbi:MAG: ATP-dependent DNA helicase RecG [Campylobacteraceae bacterium]|jgi:ATP-dependent DNA helicase RecG|nr:ATP-dependent DNA helicase RecG [Campylobacteraceae bacterium]